MARHQLSEIEGNTERESQAPRIPAGGQSGFYDSARIDPAIRIDQAYREAHRSRETIAGNIDESSSLMRDVIRVACCTFALSLAPC